MPPGETKPPPAAPDDYRRASDDLLRRLATDAGALALVSELEHLIRIEQESAIPAELRLSTRLAAARAPLPRRTALISDIHGHLPGLLAALADIETQSCDAVVCLGDLVEGGTDDEAVIETLMARGIPCVRGNHDEFNDVVLSAGARSFLAGLPERRVAGEALYVHISPRHINRKIDHVVEAWNVFDENASRLTFVGHVHIPHIFGKRSTTYGEATRHAFSYNRPFEFSPDDSYIVSIGAIGYGRDLVGRIRYAIYDREACTVEIRAIDGPLLPLDHALR